MIKYSIIIPVYNRADSIAACIESVLNQSYRNYEIIVVNDGSTDATSRKIETYYDKIISIAFQENRGVNFARNRGIEKVSGDYIIFLDSDDQLTTNALLEINNTIAVHPNIQHFLFNVSDRSNDENLPINNSLIEYKNWITEEITGDFVHVIKPSCFNNRMFFESFRAFESLNWIRVLKYSSPQFFNNTILCNRNRQRNDSLTNTLFLYQKKAISEQFDFLKKYLSMYASDIKKYNRDVYNKKIRKCFILAMSLGEYDYAKSMLRKMYGFEHCIFKIGYLIKIKKIYNTILSLKSRIGALLN